MYEVLAEKAKGGSAEHTQLFLRVTSTLDRNDTDERNRSMSDTRELLKDGNFVLKTTYYYEDRQDMGDFHHPMVDPYESDIEVNYQDGHVEVLLRPGW